MIFRLWNYYKEKQGRVLTSRFWGHCHVISVTEMGYHKWWLTSVVTMGTLWRVSECFFVRWLFWWRGAVIVFYFVAYIGMSYENTDDIPVDILRFQSARQLCAQPVRRPESKWLWPFALYGSECINTQTAHSLRAGCAPTAAITAEEKISTTFVWHCQWLVSISALRASTIWPNFLMRPIYDCQYSSDPCQWWKPR